ncbi:hypothetical protein N7461_005086 [Penicillium sp. DV-2018c]|nr:hypothetical protein N7461_005086 [Penicillium sp. DV-2018c]
MERLEEQQQRMDGYQRDAADDRRTSKEQMDELKKMFQSVLAKIDGEREKPPAPPTSQANKPDAQRSAQRSQFSNDVENDDLLATTGTSWRISETGVFDPGQNFRDGAGTMQNVTVYSDVYVFVDRLKDLAVFKTEATVRANVQNILRGQALSRYTQELTEHEKRMLIHTPLRDGSTYCSSWVSFHATASD